MYGIAVVNRKGGVGKTTTVHSLGHALAAEGRKVLLVDLDPQGNLSRWCDVPTTSTTLADVAHARASLGETIRTVGEGVSIIPGSDALIEAEARLSGSESIPQTWLRRHLATLRRDRFDVVILDCAPSLGLLTVAGIVASDGVLMPLEAAPLALEGLVEMLGRVDQARELRPELAIVGVVVTRFDQRKRLARDALEMIEQAPPLSGVPITTIRHTVRMEEAPGRRKSIFEHAPESTASEDYRTLAKEVLSHVG